ncbi:zinc finger protein rotund-like [Malaya genurostris]|uniref:zinc finger protein rotund-like n=1 Tax=Malaya genurostris TaxID=325434 RepID=UPI0026F3B707|nr:zinc finger protein rotund-like [Malaya genurostris]
MAQIKLEPLEIDDHNSAVGATSASIIKTGFGNSQLLMMESSTSSSCVMGQQDLMIDNAKQQTDETNQPDKDQTAQPHEDDVKLAIMNTEDPLLQETINALMNGTGGIEAVGATGVPNEIESERNYECNFCGKLFTRSNTLSYHLKVHNDEKPFKCGNCDKAFREQYRLTKHQRTHAKDHQDQEMEHSQDSSFQSKTGEDEDYATGDSERFFQGYELQEGTAVMKLEPDISLTVDGSTTNPATQAPSENDVRYQIIEERIKSLQREVHLVNQNLNRVETKLDGLTKIIAIFINKFDEAEPQPNPPSSANTVIPIPIVTVPIGNLPTVQTQTVSMGQLQQISPPQQQQQPIQMISHHPNSIAAAAVQMQTAPKVELSQPFEHSSSNAANANINTFVSNGNGSLVSGNDTFPEIPELPIRTVNDFLDLNDHCTDNEQFLLQMMIRLHQEVDSSQPHQRNVKKMMESLVTYEVLCQFSWSGKSAINGQYTKYVFGNSLGIIDLLTKTLNLGKSDEEAEANLKPIFTSIQSFIKHSRQNMLRDSRKRRESNGPLPPALRSGFESQVKQIKAEKVDMFNQF